MRRWRERAQHLEAIEARHLHIEQEQVRLPLFNLGQRLQRVSRLADNLHFRMRAEQFPQPRPGRSFVVYDQGLEFHLWVSKC